MSVSTSSSVSVIADIVSELFPALTNAVPEDEIANVVERMNCWAAPEMAPFAAVIPSLQEMCKRAIVKYAGAEDLTYIEQTLNVELLGIVADYRTPTASESDLVLGSVPPPPTGSPPIVALTHELRHLVIGMDGFVKKADSIIDEIHILARDAYDERKIAREAQAQSKIIADAVLAIMQRTTG